MVYVDQIRHVVPKSAQARACGSQWCHMMADSPAELHAMAKKLGLKRCWAQCEGTLRIHYDMVPSKRAQAVALGAVEVSTRFLVGLWRKPT